MPNTKISAETALAAAPATNDLLPIVDVSDTTDAATGTTKKITVANLFTTPTIGSFTNANHDHTNSAGGGQLTDSALSTAIGIAKGGTGQTTNTAAFDALAPTTTAGDTIYHNGSDNIRLGIGTAGQVLRVNSGATAPEWGSPSKIEIDTTEVTVGNTDVEATLFDTTIPANTLSTNNALRITSYVELKLNGGGGATGIFRLKYGATTIAELTLTMDGATSGDPTYKGILTGYIVGDGATDAQKGILYFSGGDSVMEEDAQATVGGSKGVGAAKGTAAIDSTSSQTLTLTADFGTTNVASTVTAEFWIVERI